MNKYTKKWDLIPQEERISFDRLFGVPPLRDILQFTGYCSTYKEMRDALCSFSADRLKIIRSVIDDILTSRGVQV